MVRFSFSGHELMALPQGAFLVAWAPGHGWVAVPVTPPHASGQPVPPGTAPTPTPQGRR